MKLKRIWQGIRTRGRQVLVYLKLLSRVAPIPSRCPSPINQNESNQDYLGRNRHHLPGPRDFGGMEVRNAVVKFREKLSPYEHLEVWKYQKIYTVGYRRPDEKIFDNHEKEMFVDNDRNYIGIQYDHINYRYVILAFIGEGGYSRVYRCLDKKFMTTVAVKMMKDIPGDRYREAAMLLKISRIKSKAKSHIVKIRDYDTFRQQVFLVTLSYNYDLSIYLKHTPCYHLRERLQMAKVVLRALDFLREHHIIHGDLKPANILFNKRNPLDLKLADFGLSTMSNQPVGNNMYQTFTYRAPEVFLGGQATCAMDMWSFGVLLSEMVGKNFLNGRNDKEQFICILEYFGMPPNDYLDSMEKCSRYFHDRRLPKCCVYPPGQVGVLKCELDMSTKYTYQNRKNPGESDMRDVFPEPELHQVYWFLTRCFTWEPGHRILPTFALRHPLFLFIDKKGEKKRRRRGRRRGRKQKR